MHMKLVGLIRTIDPLHHGRECEKDESGHNIYKIEKQEIFCEDGTIVAIPYIKGAAFAGQLRDRLAESFIASTGIKKEKVPADYIALLWSAGLLKKVSMRTSDLAKISQLFPSTGLMGFSFGSLMSESKTFFSNLYPVAHENKFQTIDFLDTISNKLGLNPPKISAEDMVERVTRIRRMDGTTEEFKIKEKETKLKRRVGKDEVQNIWTMEYIKAGIYLTGDITIANASEIEIGCFLDGLRVFSLDENRRLGGTIKRGFGGVTFEAYVTFSDDRWGEPIAEYHISLRNGITKKLLSGKDVLDSYMNTYKKHMERNKALLERMFAEHKNISDKDKKFPKFLDSM